MTKTDNLTLTHWIELGSVLLGEMFWEKVGIKSDLGLHGKIIITAAAATAAKSRQSCLTPCDPLDSSSRSYMSVFTSKYCLRNVSSLTWRTDLCIQLGGRRGRDKLRD